MKLNWPMVLNVRVDARRDRAMFSAKIVAEPGDDQRDAFEIGAKRLQRVDRRGPVRRRGELMAIFRRRGAGRVEIELEGRVIAGLRRAGNEVDGPDHRAESFDGLHDFEGELRNAIAEGREREILENDIGEAAIGGRVLRPFLGDDQRIGLLILAPAIDADRQRRHVEL